MADTDHQSARVLVDSINTLSKTTRELIHAQVLPFSRQGVADYLCEYETGQGWTSPSMREANAVDVSSSSRPKRGSTKVRCTNTVCQGPHPEDDCWAKPGNYKKKDQFLARRNGERKTSSVTPQAATIRGRKKIAPPFGNAAG